MDSHKQNNSITFCIKATCLFYKRRIKKSAKLYVVDYSNTHGTFIMIDMTHKLSYWCNIQH